GRECCKRPAGSTTPSCSNSEASRHFSLCRIHPSSLRRGMARSQTTRIFWRALVCDQTCPRRKRIVSCYADLTWVLDGQWNYQPIVEPAIPLLVEEGNGSLTTRIFLTALVCDQTCPRRKRIVSCYADLTW